MELTFYIIMSVLVFSSFGNDDAEFGEDDDDNTDTAYIELFAKAVNAKSEILMAKLLAAKGIIANPSGQGATSVEWSKKFCTMMKEAETCFVFNDLSHGRGYIMQPNVFHEVFTLILSGIYVCFKDA